MRLIIFDADGTMLNSRAALLSGFRQVFEDFDLTIPTEDEILSTIGLSLDLVFADILKRPVDDEIRKMSARYKEISVSQKANPDLYSSLYDGIDETIQALALREDHLLGIATGKSRRGLNEMIDRLGYQQHILVSRTADDCPSKPHPAMILECCNDVGCDPENTMMVGDSSYDMIMAREAGVKSLAVSWGYQPVDKLMNSGADALVESPFDLVDAIDQLFEKN